MAKLLSNCGPTPYEVGRRFEYKVQALLRNSGYYVIRSAGSKGIFDLVAVNNKHTLMIQCKYSSLFNHKIDDVEWNRLKESIPKYSGILVLAKNDKKKGIIFELISNGKEFIL